MYEFLKLSLSYTYTLLFRNSIWYGSNFDVRTTIQTDYDSTVNCTKINNRYDFFFRFAPPSCRYFFLNINRECDEFQQNSQLQMNVKKKSDFRFSILF